MKFAEQVKHLGGLLHASLRGHSDIQRQVKLLCCAGYTFRNFLTALLKLKTHCFVPRACLSIMVQVHTQPSIKRLCVAYNNAYRI